MNAIPSQPRVVKFGVFEVDLKSGELRKAGMRQKLAGQPFQILQALLEHPQEIVTREQLRQCLWPDSRYVDYELALKKAVNRLREALGDSAENPRFIETIPRHGYRFIGFIEAPKQPDPVPVALTYRPGRKVHWTVVAGLFLAMIATLLFGLSAGKLSKRIFAKTETPDIRSIAVLPLENLSKDASQDYFSDGITDALTTDLAQIGPLRVISRTSAMHFKGSRETLPEIGSKLNVDAIVEGSVTRSENRVRITAQLIDTRSDRHLWARTYERDLKDVLFLQDELARDIAEEIRIKLKPEERAHLTQARLVNPEAHESCLKGRYFYDKMSVPGFTEAVNHYRHAIAVDPSYAPAYVGLAASYKELGTWGALPPKEAFPQAMEAVEKALELDSNLGDAHAVRGHIHFLWDWDWQGAEQEYRRAFELDSPSTDTRIQYAVFLSAIGRNDKAIEVMKEARTLDPVSPNSNGLLGIVYYWAHRFDEAIDQFQKTLTLYPDYSIDHFFLGHCYERKGMFAEAMEEYLKGKALYGATSEELTKFRLAFAKSGRKGFLQEDLKTAIASSKGHYVDPYSIAELYARLDEKDQAFQWLERAYQERSHHVPLIDTNPMLDGLRSDPRFQDLLNRMNLSTDSRRR